MHSTTSGTLYTNYGFSIAMARINQMALNFLFMCNFTKHFNGRLFEYLAEISHYMPIRWKLSAQLVTWLDGKRFSIKRLFKMDSVSIAVSNVRCACLQIHYQLILDEMIQFDTWAAKVNNNFDYSTIGFDFKFIEMLWSRRISSILFV